jgi:hypothetical protein
VIGGLVEDAAKAAREMPGQPLALLILHRDSPAYAVWRTIGEQAFGHEVTSSWIAMVVNRDLAFQTLRVAGLPEAALSLHELCDRDGSRSIPTVVGDAESFTTTMIALPSLPGTRDLHHAPCPGGPRSFRGDEDPTESPATDE